jgi:hypothetical protein
MRSRPNVKLWHGPNVVPGSRVPVTLELTFKTETPVSCIDVELRGFEFAGYGAGNQRRTAEWKNVALRRTFEGQTYKPGTYKYELTFDLPFVPPTHVGLDARVRYELFVRVDIPWWPDRTAAYELPVGFPLAEPYPPKPVVYTTRDESGSTEPAIELSVDTMDASINEMISGQISITDLGARTCRSVELAVVQLENLREPTVFSRHTTRFGRRLHTGQPPDGETLPFSIRLPRGLHPSFEGKLYGTSAILEVKCDIALGTDVVLRAPLIVRPPLNAPRTLGPELIQPVGKGRLHRVFSVVAGRLGLAYNEQRRLLTGRAGNIAFTMGLTHQQDGYYRYVRYEFPSLGVDFLVEPKGTGNLFGLKSRSAGEIPGYVVTARDPEQVGTLAFKIGRRAADYQYVEASDSHLCLTQKGDASTVHALMTFALNAINFGNELSDEMGTLPAPLGMEAYVAAWQAYAEQTGGTFTRTAMRIQGARVGFDTLSMVTHFAVHGVPTDTTLTLTLDPPLSLPPSGFDLSSPDLSANARALARAMMDERKVEILPTEINVSVPGAVPDPSTHGPLIERLSALAAAIRGQVAQIPYR